ncbi:MAG: hypothetical protein PUG33_05455 [Mollicutes bacterium]|nr:hypothetical protein [Mollicutes bacterium]MDY5875184.1 hypothetical protein [Bacilli bacterium]
MEKTMKKSYRISRIILAVITVVIFNIMFINEDESWRIIPFIFAAIVFGLSYPSSVISRKLINIGNKIESKLLKILYYVIALPIIAFLIFYGIFIIWLSIFASVPTPNEMGAALGQGFMFLFLLAVVFIGIILPYVQTIIVLILNQFIKNQ